MRFARSSFVGGGLPALKVKWLLTLGVLAYLCAFFSSSKLAAQDSLLTYRNKMHFVGVDFDEEYSEKWLRAWRKYECREHIFSQELEAHNIKTADFWDFTMDEDGESHPEDPFGYVVSDDNVREVVRFPSIRHVNFRASVSPDALQTIAELPNLCAISIELDPTIMPDMLQILSGAEKVRTLVLARGWHAEPRAHPCPGLGKFKNLEFLELGYYFADGTLQSKQVCHEIAQLKQLNTLWLGFGPRYPPDLSALKDLEHLETIATDVCDCEITCRELAKLPHLKELRLRMPGLLGGEALNFSGLAKLSQLESLTLDLRPVRPDAESALFIAPLSRLPQLRQLELTEGNDNTILALSNLKSESIEEIRLIDYTHVTDDSIAALAKQFNLKRLKLFNCNGITDKGLLALAAMTNLEQLEVDWTLRKDEFRITRKGASELHEMLPHCEISITNDGWEPTDPQPEVEIF